MHRSHSTSDQVAPTHVDGARAIDAPLQEALDRVSSLVSRLLGASIVTFVLTGDGRYVTASNVGLGECFADFPLPLAGSLCEHVVQCGERFATSGAEVATNVVGPDFGTSYAATKLRDVSGEVIGAFCAIDGPDRIWNVSDLAILTDFAGLVSDHLTFDDTRR